MSDNRGIHIEKVISPHTASRATLGVPSRELQAELVRKGVHLLIALVPLFASINVYITLVLLGAGTIFYAWAEKLRFEGKKVFIVSTITNLSLRERDRGKYVLGPVTLGLGAMAALFFYPEPAASIAIYALAFGDSFSSIIGKAFGGIKIPLTGGKTVSGSITCFITVFAVSAFITANPTASLVIAFAATFFEALPIRDMDNIIIPVGSGMAAYLMLL